MPILGLGALLFAQLGCSETTQENSRKMDSPPHKVFGKELAVIKPPSPIYGATMSPDGTRVVTISIHGNDVILWNAETGEQIEHFRRHLNLETTSSNAAAFSPDSSMVVIPALHAGIEDSKPVGGDRAFEVVDARTGRVIRTVLGPHLDRLHGYYSESGIAFSQDGRRLAALLGGGQYINTAVYDTKEWSILSVAETQDATALAISSSGDQLAIGFIDGRIELRDALTDAVKWKIDAYRQQWVGHGNVYQVLFDQTGDRLFSASSSVIEALPEREERDPAVRQFNDESIRLWSVSDGSRLDSFVTGPHRTESEVVSIALSPQDRILVAAKWKYELVAMDTVTHSGIDRLDTHPALVRSVKFSADGKKLMMAAQNVAVVFAVTP